LDCGGVFALHRFLSFRRRASKAAATHKGRRSPNIPSPEETAAAAPHNPQTGKLGILSCFFTHHFDESHLHQPLF
jgi:hypothetical protein